MITAAEAAGGTDSVELWQPLAALARAKRGLGHPEEARPLLERAKLVAEKAQADPADLAKLVSELATP